MLSCVISRFDWLHSPNAPSWALFMVAVVGILLTIRTLREMTYQTKITQVAATAAKNGGDALINSERAWLMVDLGWYKGDVHIAEQTSTESEHTSESTSVNLKVTCRNAGKSPAWIDNVYWRVIPAVPPIPDRPDRRHGHNMTWLEPIAPGDSAQRVLQARFSGHVKQGEFITAYVVIEYHDIFGIRRETRSGYSIDDDANIYRMEARPEWNNNT